MWYNLISDEDRGNTEFIYNLSYGKDSFAGLHVTIDILGIPVHRIVHAEVLATDTIPADLPPMVEFKAKADAYIKARWGLTVEHICATRDGERLTYEKLFYHVPERKNPNRGGAPEIRALLNQHCGYDLKDDEVILLIIRGIAYFIADITLRMLTPRELYNAMGFPVDYQIEQDYTGNAYPKSKQVARCGNAVCPPLAEAMVRANLPEWCGKKITTMSQLDDAVAV